MRFLLNSLITTLFIFSALQPAFSAQRLEISHSDSPRYDDFQSLTQVVKGGVVQISPDGLQTSVSSNLGLYYISSLFFSDGSSRLTVSPRAEDTNTALSQIQSWIREQNNSSGTGFFIQDNLILTNAHVVKTANFVRFYPSSITSVVDKEQWLQGKVIWRSWKSNSDYRALATDFALIEIDATNVEKYKELLKNNNVEPYVFKATSNVNSSQAGQQVATYSNPARNQGYLSLGNIVDSVTQYKDQERVVDLANATQGSSGGPLYNLKGELIGVIFGMANPDANSGLRPMYYSPIELVLDMVNADQLSTNGYGLTWFFRHFLDKSKASEDYALQTITEKPLAFQTTERKFGMIVKSIPKDLQTENSIKEDDLIYAIDGHQIQIQYHRMIPNGLLFVIQKPQGLYSLEHYLTENENKPSFNLTVFRNGESGTLEIAIPNVIRAYSDKSLKVINSLNNLNSGPRYTEISGFNFVDLENANSQLFTWLNNNLSFDYIPEESVIISSFNQIYLSNNSDLVEKNRELFNFYYLSQRSSFSRTSELSELHESFTRLSTGFGLMQYSIAGTLRLKSFNGHPIFSLADLDQELDKARNLGYDTAMLEVENYQAGNEQRMTPVVDITRVPIFIGSDDLGNESVVNQLLGNLGGN